MAFSKNIRTRTALLAAHLIDLHPLRRKES